jgi:hypothetical protein
MMICRARDNANLAELQVSVPGLDSFDPDTTTYDLAVSALVRSLRVTASPQHVDATIEIDGAPLTAGEASLPVAVSPDAPVTINVTVTAPAGNQKTYVIDVQQKESLSELDLGADNPDPDDTFGWRVAVGEYMGTRIMAVSAPAEDSMASGVRDRGEPDDNCTDSGAVYMFRRQGSGWTQEAYLKPSDTGCGDEFGIGLALDGDTLVVGAFGEEENEEQVDSGAAYVFRRESGGWVQKAKLKPSSIEAGQEFGWSVAVAGDLIAVGARRENNDSGAVYVFHRDNEDWTEDRRIEPSAPAPGALFGYSVAITQDFLVVGACGRGEVCKPAGNPPPENMTAGDAYVFQREEGDWPETSLASLVSSPAPAPDSDFGFAVAAAGDKIVIGAPSQDGSGAAYVFGKATGSWKQEDELPRIGAGFGTSVAIAGTLVAVGSRDPASEQNGVVSLFGSSDDRWSKLGDEVPVSVDGDDDFGWSVALSDDTLVVGARFYSTVGAVYIYN